MKNPIGGRGKQVNLVGRGGVRARGKKRGKDGAQFDHMSVRAGRDSRKERTDCSGRGREVLPSQSPGPEVQKRAGGQSGGTLSGVSYTASREKTAGSNKEGER